MRVALAINSLGPGGAERQVVEIANTLSRSGHEVHIILFSLANPLAQRVDTGTVTLHSFQRTKLRTAKCILWVRSLFREHKFDICHAFSLDTEIISIVARVFSSSPVVIISERNSDYVLSHRRKVLKKFAATYGDFCIANSHSGLRFHSELFGQPKDKYGIVTNSVDTAVFYPRSPHESRKCIDIPTDAISVGMVASFKHQKNHPMLLRSIPLLRERFPNLIVVLIGDSLKDGFGGSDEYRAEVTQLIRSLGIEDIVRVLGRRDDMEDIYSGLDVVVLTSRHEGTPNVVLESLASGVPVVVTRVSDNARIIGASQCGYLVDLDDDEGLVRSIEQTLADQAFRSKVRQAGPAFVSKNYSKADMGFHVLSAYRNAIERRQSPAA